MGGRGSPVWDGTVSLDGFKASATALIKRWKEIEVDDSLPDWTWKPCRKMGVPSEVEGYLALEGVYRSCGGSQEQIEEGGNFDDADIAGDDTWILSCSDNVHVYDFHVIYSFSYKVPVLYFQGHLSGGQLLNLDEEHPHLSRPWFTLHPCGTSDWMKLLLEESVVADKDQSLQYLPAWLSVVGQAVGLKIPLELHCNS